MSGQPAPQRDAVLAVVRASGAAGVCMRQVAGATLLPPTSCSTTLCLLAKMGQIHKAGKGTLRRYFGTAAQAEAAGPRLRNMQKVRSRQPVLVNGCLYVPPAEPAGEVVMHADAPAGLAPGVRLHRDFRRVVVAPVRDDRFTVDPATFQGGEFAAEWARRRGGAR